MTTLKPKEKKFLKEYMTNGNNAKKAAKVALPHLTDGSAEVTGHKILRKIKEETPLLDKYLPEDLLFKKHQALLNQKQLAYFVFPKKMEDDEITEHMLANGLVTVVIRESDKGKLAFYTMDDAQAISKALDMGFKLRGSYAPEKSVNVNVDVGPDSPRIIELTETLNNVRRSRLHTGGSEPSNGAATDSLDREVSD